MRGVVHRNLTVVLQEFPEGQQVQGNFWNVVCIVELKIGVPKFEECCPSPQYLDSGAWFAGFYVL